MNNTAKKELLYALPGVFSLLLTLSWGWRLGQSDNDLPVIGDITEGHIFSFFLCVALIALFFYRENSVKDSIKNFKLGNFGSALVDFIIAFMVVILLLGTSFFDLENRSGHAVTERLQAMESYQKAHDGLTKLIESAEKDVDKWKSYASEEQADKADLAVAQEAALLRQERKAERKENQERVEVLRNQVTALLAMVPQNSRGKNSGRTLGAWTADCTKTDSYYYSAGCAEVAQLKQTIVSLMTNSVDAVDSGVIGANLAYSEKHAKYKGAEAHLEKVKADLEALEKGETIKPVWRPEDVWLAKRLGISEAQASAYKLLFLAAVLDIIYLLRLFVNAWKTAPGRELTPEDINRKAFEAMHGHLTAQELYKGLPNLVKQFGLGGGNGVSVLPGQQPEIDHTAYQRGIDDAKAGAKTSDNPYPAGALTKIKKDSWGAGYAYAVENGMFNAQPSTESSALTSGQPDAVMPVAGVETPFPQPKHGKHFLNIVLGKTVGGQDAVINIAEVKHILEGGKTDAGKSSSMRLKINQLLEQSPQDVQMVMTDLKNGAAFWKYKDVPHLAIPLATTKENAIGNIKWLVDEVHRRQRVITQEHDCEDVFEFVDTKGYWPFPALVSFIDELAEITLVSKEAEDMLAEIHRLGRSAGVYSNVCTQQPRADVVSTKVSSQCTRMALAVERAEDSKIILGVNGGGAEKLTEAGHAILKHKGLHHIKLDYYPPETAREAAEKAIAKWGKASFDNNDADSGSNYTGVERQPQKAQVVELPRPVLAKYADRIQAQTTNGDIVNMACDTLAALGKHELLTGTYIANALKEAGVTTATGCDWSKDTAHKHVKKWLSENSVEGAIAA